MSKSDHTFPLSSSLRFLELNESTSPERDRPQSIGLADGATAKDVVSYAIKHGMQQIVQKSSLDFNAEIQVSALMLDDGRRYLDYPISAVLDPENVSAKREDELTLFKAVYHSSKRKGEFLEELRKRVSTFATSMFTDEVCAAADELYSNAFFHAPAGENRMRTDEIVTEHPATLMCGRSESRLVIGCRDLYGSLNLAGLLRRLYECFERGPENAMNWSATSGAGIGIYMLFNSSSSFYIGVEPGKSTVICCTFPLKLASKKRQALPKNLHLLALKSAK